MASNNRLAAGMSFGTQTVYQNVPHGANPLNSTGVETSFAVSGTIQYTWLWVPSDKTISIVGYLMGSTAAGLVSAGIWDQNGSLITASVSSGVSPPGGSVNFWHEITLSTSAFLAGPGLYFVGVQGSSNSRIRVMASSSYVLRAGSTAAAPAPFAMPASIPVAPAFPSNNGCFTYIL